MESAAGAAADGGLLMQVLIHDMVRAAPVAAILALAWWLLIGLPPTGRYRRMLSHRTNSHPARRLMAQAESGRAGSVQAGSVQAGSERAGRIRQRWGRTSRRPNVDALLPVLIHQMAALLEAGRSHHMLWADTVSAWRLVLDNGVSHDDGRRAAGECDDVGAGNDPVLPVLEAAERAAALGHSVADALRNAARSGPALSESLRSGPDLNRLRIWKDLADCWDVAERSGAPLAAILMKYAAQLESDEDAESARRTALAGPKATVQLLNWLPLFGIGLALVMGINPLAVLFGTGIGWAALATGITLMLIGRRWTTAMVAAAANPMR